MIETGKYRDAIKEDEDLALFMRNLAEFDEAFSRNMFRGKDFTLKFEVHGAAGKICHCRVHNDGFDRPSGSKKKKNG